MRSPYSSLIGHSRCASAHRLALTLGRCIALPIPGYCATNSSHWSMANESVHIGFVARAGWGGGKRVLRRGLAEVVSVSSARGGHTRLVTQ